MRVILLLLLSLVVLVSGQVAEVSLVNPAHLNNLYKEILMDKDSAAFVYIYAEYPGYEPVEAGGEGIACVDDVARAAIFYFRYYKTTGQKENLTQGKRLINFILRMQAGNGLFYNFINSNYSINKTGFNSQAKADWWTWRALWAISEAMLYAKENDPAYFEILKRVFLKSINGLADIQEIPKIIADLAADQASVFLLALTNYYSLPKRTC